MPRFVVDSASLDRVRDRLGILHGQLLATPDIVGAYTDTMLGGGMLEAELDGFARRWHYEVGVVASEIDHMQTRLSGAAAAYQRIEDHTRDRAHDHRSHRSGSGSGVTVIGAGGGAGGSGVGSGTTVIGGVQLAPGANARDDSGTGR